MQTIQLKCNNCHLNFNKNVYVYRSDVKRNTDAKFYCCKECNSQHQSKVGSIKVTCCNCGVVFKKKNSHIIKTKLKNHFCSRDCNYKYTISSNLQKWSVEDCKKFLLSLEKFGTKRTLEIFKTNDKTARRYVKELLGISITDVNRKTVNFLNMTKEHLFKTRKNWQSARSNVQRKSRERYLESGGPMGCLICGYTHHVEIAHIKAVSDFSDNDTVFQMTDPSNLIALCPNHHWEFDNGILDKSIAKP